MINLRKVFSFCYLRSCLSFGYVTVLELCFCVRESQPIRTDVWKSLDLSPCVLFPLPVSGLSGTPRTRLG